MKFEDYINQRHRIFNQQDANKECLNINWASLSLGGEIGEFQNLVNKINRDDGGLVTSDRAEQMNDELGDILWYWLFVFDILKFDPGDIMENNLEKLKKRYGIE